MIMNERSSGRKQKFLTFNGNVDNQFWLSTILIPIEKATMIFYAETWWLPVWLMTQMLEFIWRLVNKVFFIQYLIQIFSFINTCIMYEIKTIQVKDIFVLSNFLSRYLPMPVPFLKFVLDSYQNKRKYFSI